MPTNQVCHHVAYIHRLERNPVVRLVGHYAHDRLNEDRLVFRDALQAQTFEILVLEYRRDPFALYRMMNPQTYSPGGLT